ncbi:MAG: hypothetical protein IT223_06855 [Crocinitomicaceae bacterium]|nr:hypothetical protein [Crocinitomicaceae bacterium]
MKPFTDPRKMTTVRAFLVLIPLLYCFAVSAQVSKYDKSKEIGMMAGTSYYIGEVNPYKHFGTRLHPGFGLSFRNNFSRRWTAKVSALYGHIEAWDSDSKDPWIRNRNLNFKNQFFEGSVQAELNFFDYQIGSDDNLSPYLFTGLAYYGMNPQGNLNGLWRPLQPAGTEGQGTSEGTPLYKNNGFAIPVGVGVKANLFTILGVSLEWGLRRTWTDYFDDISGSYINPNILEDEKSRLSARLSDQSLVKERADGTNAGLQRGDPGKKDLYFFMMLSLNIRIDEKATSCWEGHRISP